MAASNRGARTSLRFPAKPQNGPTYQMATAIASQLWFLIYSILVFVSWLTESEETKYTVHCVLPPREAVFKEFLVGESP
jgi:hypothetical protein